MAPVPSHFLLSSSSSPLYNVSAPVMCSRIRRALVMRCALFAASVISLQLFSATCLGAEEWNEFGPLYDRFPLTLTPGERTEAFGPFFSREKREQEEVIALSPVWSYRHDESTDFAEHDFLYPLLTLDRFGLEYRWQFLQLFSFSGGQTMDTTGKRRITLFPFYFQQRSPDPELNYTAVVPFYGTLKNRLFRDEIKFIMMPVYVQTRKRDVVTDNYLAPFFHLRRGDALKGWQFWPLVGHERKLVTTRTNQYDEVETIGGHEKRFVLWPLWIKNELGLGTTNVQRQFVSLPLYSAQRAPMRDSTTFLWPFGLTITDDREKQYREWAFPWPFIDFARGEGKTLNRVWPLFSVGRTKVLESQVYLWPLYRRTQLKSDPLDRQRTRILFFVYSDLVERNTATGTELERTALWPLFTARREHDGSERLQLFAPLEPLLPASTAVERNYAPLWSVWRSERNGKTGAASQSFLWNLYRRETTPTTKKCSLLFGAFGYQSGPDGTRWRLFYVPVVKPKKGPPENP
jgi:hypothetical protein